MFIKTKENILIIAVGYLKDFVDLIFFVQAVNKKYPNYSIDVIMTDIYKPFIEKFPFIRKIYTIPYDLVLELNEIIEIYIDNENEEYEDDDEYEEDEFDIKEYFFINNLINSLDSYELLFSLTLFISNEIAKNVNAQEKKNVFDFEFDFWELYYALVSEVNDNYIYKCDFLKGILTKEYVENFSISIENCNISNLIDTKFLSPLYTVLNENPNQKFVGIGLGYEEDSKGFVDFIVLLINIIESKGYKTILMGDIEYGIGKKIFLKTGKKSLNFIKDVNSYALEISNIISKCQLVISSDYSINVLAAINNIKLIQISGYQKISLYSASVWYKNEVIICDVLSKTKNVLDFFKDYFDDICSCNEISKFEHFLNLSNGNVYKKVFFKPIEDSFDFMLIVPFNKISIDYVDTFFEILKFSFIAAIQNKDLDETNLKNFLTEYYKYDKFNIKNNIEILKEAYKILKRLEMGYKNWHISLTKSNYSFSTKNIEDNFKELEYLTKKDFCLLVLLSNIFELINILFESKILELLNLVTKILKNQINVLEALFLED